MSKNDPAMQRMKDYYESRSRTFLTRRVPAIIRLDGRSFSNYTKNLEKPFDDGFIEDMNSTAIYLCEGIQGCKAAYVQSDEISLLLTDWDKNKLDKETDGWFNYNVQKMVSISAARAAGKFNQLRLFRAIKFNATQCDYDYDTFLDKYLVRETGALMTGDKYLSPLAEFDSRAFSVPSTDVPNYFYARQRDAVKNSISMVAQSLYSHTELLKKNGSEKQEMIFQKGQNWNDLHWGKKRGRWIVRNTYVNGEIAKVYPTCAYLDADIGKLEFCPKNCREDIKANICRRYMPEPDGREYWETIEIETIRHKWEVVEETPMKLNDSGLYKNWL